MDRWRKLFAEVTAQLDEIEGKAENAAKQPTKQDREKQQAELAQAQPSFDFKVENRTIALTWKNLREVTVNYYLMDPEFLFSSSPFVSADPGRFSIIKPTKTMQVPLPGGKDALEVPLPAEFAKANVLVEMLGAGQRKAQPYHANALKLTLAENYGHLEVARELGTRQAGEQSLRESLCAPEKRQGALLQGRLHRPAREVRLRQPEQRRQLATGAPTAADPLGIRRHGQPRLPDAQALGTRPGRASQHPADERSPRSRHARGGAADSIATYPDALVCARRVKQ